MSVTYWDKNNVFRQKIYEHCDSDGPWAFRIYDARFCRRPEVNMGLFLSDDDESDGGRYGGAMEPLYTKVVRIGETHYVLEESMYDSRDDVHDESWLKLVCMGLLLNPCYPHEHIGEPADDGTYDRRTSYITGTFVSWEGAEATTHNSGRDGALIDAQSPCSYKRSCLRRSNPYCFHIPSDATSTVRSHWRFGSLTEFSRTGPGSWSKLPREELDRQRSEALRGGRCIAAKQDHFFRWGIEPNQG